MSARIGEVQGGGEEEEEEEEEGEGEELARLWAWRR
jgi:hypothetical protein